MSTHPLFTHTLLVEDEISLGEALEIALRRISPSIERVESLRAARQFVNQNTPDLVIIDRRLPDGEGLELCRELRERSFDGIILILTAHGEVESRVEGLEAGADDYLAKPFSWEELMARLQALARRRKSKPRLTSTWTLDADQLKILGPKGWVQLTPLEFRLASHLITAQGSIVSRDTLLSDVWGFTLLPKTRTVDHFLGRLRKYFEIDPENPKHFLTVRGAGYRFNS